MPIQERADSRWSRAGLCGGVGLGPGRRREGLFFFNRENGDGGRLRCPTNILGACLILIVPSGARDRTFNFDWIKSQRELLT